QIESASGCPTAADIDGRLVPLLPPGFAMQSSDRAIITDDADGLSVALARSDGRSVARRRLPRAGTCADQAETVAVTLAVWEAQIHPEIALRLDRLAGGPPAAVAAPAPAADRDLTLARSAEKAHARELTATVGGAVVG